MNQNLMPALNYYNNLSPWAADMYIDIQKQAQMLVSRNLLSDFNFLLFLAGWAASVLLPIIQMYILTLCIDQ
jgi:hypothetical protein